MFKSTPNILENPWKHGVPNITYTSPPPKTEWNYDRDPTIHDIILWEQIYYEAGNIGVYAAWDPYVDLYMVTYNLFINLPAGIKCFYGKDSIDKIIKIAKDIGTDIEIQLT